MSDTYSLVCRETKQKVWIGQGYKLSSFYSGEPGCMKALHRLLRETIGKKLEVVMDGIDDDEVDECTELWRPDEDEDGA